MTSSSVFSDIDLDVTDYENKAPSDLNGNLIGIDMTSPATFISPDNHIVVGSGNTLDLVGSMAHAIWVAQGNPAASTKVTKAHLEAAEPRIKKLFAIYTVHLALAAADRPLASRSSDCIPRAKFDSAAYADTVVAAAKKVYGHIMADELLISKMGENADLSILALFANAIHRHGRDGHNWLTASAVDKASVAYRCLAVAGAKRDDFVKYMAINGHDMWHHLSSDSLAVVCTAIAGKAAEGDTGPLKLCKDVKTMTGVTYSKGTHVAQIFGPGDAAIDRYPPGVLGKAALITGVDAVVDMMTSITSKVSVDCAGAIGGCLSELRMSIAKANPSREALGNMRAALGGVIAVGHGYRAANPANALTGKTTPALSAHAATRPADDSAGRALYGIISEVYADKSAGEAALESAISTLVSAIDQAANTAEFDAIDVTGLDEADYGVEFAVDPSVKASTKMQDTMADMMGTILKSSLGAGGKDKGDGDEKKDRDDNS